MIIVKSYCAFCQGLENIQNNQLANSTFENIFRFVSDRLGPDALP